MIVHALPIYLAPVADLEDEHDKINVLDFIKDSVIPNSYSVNVFFTFHFNNTGGARVITQRIYFWNQTGLFLSREATQLPIRSRRDENLMRHN